MLNTEIDANINSIPYLLYMEEQEKAKVNVVWEDDRTESSPPKTEKQDNF